MNSYENLFCKVFIDTNEERLSLLNSIKDVVLGITERWTITSNSMELELRKNDDFNESLRFEKRDGFLYSRYYIEIEPIGDIKQEQYISSVSMLLENLWTLGYKAVAACDFENELPRKGGYRYEINTQ
ncbi:1,4-dihydroxy-6-naphthoate synthase [Clostridium beijerinckii]|uniref:1,4-dihydroxy-6-naphthoate synthase n=1 Tax=Clostridium beijerinckii TaxID=1520 RepID=UPI002430C561|nr:1,4-dihydroxy-6-naphthoate synthase [Clostridium beijerinckii]MDG5857033.1 1,4-dihydroxy-6-naphthoate synthase [Clostridium beijerinckii]